MRNGLGSTARPRSIDHVEPRPWVITERVPRTAFTAFRSAPRLLDERSVLLPKIAQPRRRRGEQVDHKAAGLGEALYPRVGRGVELGEEEREG